MAAATARALLLGGLAVIGATACGEELDEASDEVEQQGEEAVDEVQERTEDAAED